MKAQYKIEKVLKEMYVKFARTFAFTIASWVKYIACSHVCICTNKTIGACNIYVHDYMCAHQVLYIIDLNCTLSFVHAIYLMYIIQTSSLNHIAHIIMLICS